MVFYGVANPFNSFRPSPSSSIVVPRLSLTVGCEYLRLCWIASNSFLVAHTMLLSHSVFAVGFGKPYWIYSVWLLPLWMCIAPWALHPWSKVFSSSAMTSLWQNFMSPLPCTVVHMGILPGLIWYRSSVCNHIVFLPCPFPVYFIT